MREAFERSRVRAGLAWVEGTGWPGWKGRGGCGSGLGPRPGLREFCGFDLGGLLRARRTAAAVMPVEVAPASIPFCR